MAGVATLLDKNSYSGGLASNRALPMPTVRTHRRAVDNGSRSGFGSLSSGRRSPLPELRGGGARTTDNIIEAIFNPVPSSSPAISPFTYYAPPKQKLKEMNGLLAPTSIIAEEPQEGSAEDGGTGEGRPPSIAPSEQSLGTDATHETAATNVSSIGGEGLPKPKWWRRFGGNSNASSRAQSPQRRTSDNQPPPVQTQGQDHLQAQAHCQSPADSVHSLPASVEASTYPKHEVPGLSPSAQGIQIHGPEATSAPQIVVRGPTMQSEHLPPTPETR